MTRSLTFTLLAVAVLSLSACGGSASSGPEVADVPADAVQAAPTGAWVLDVAQSDLEFPSESTATMWERTGDSTLVLAGGSDVLTFRADEPLNTDVLLDTT